MTTVSGRSAADAASGCQPTASAAEEASSQSGIPNAEPWLSKLRGTPGAYAVFDPDQGRDIGYVERFYPTIQKEIPGKRYVAWRKTGKVPRWRGRLRDEMFFPRWSYRTRREAFAAIVASAIEARRAATVEQGAVHESAGPQDDAHV